MSIAEISPTKTSQHSWDWKSDSLFIQQLSEDLKRMARNRIRTGVHAISVSSLVQESLVRLLKAKCLRHPEDRSYLYTLAARAMRFVIVDHVRAQQSLKRGQNRPLTNLEHPIGVIEINNIDILAIHEAIENLAEQQPRQARIVEMKFFAGCTMPEIAQHLSLGQSTVEHDWTQAKKFLTAFLGH